MQLYTYAKLSEDELAKVRDFESRTGKTALVLKQVEAQPEMLDRDEMQALATLEQELEYLVVVVQ